MVVNSEVKWALDNSSKKVMADFKGPRKNPLKNGGPEVKKLIRRIFFNRYNSTS